MGTVDPQGVRPSPRMTTRRLKSPHALVKMRGHRIEGFAYKFPHLCPGSGCAIAKWLTSKYWSSAITQPPVTR